nr:hypothetical protein [Nocardioides alcanivorans]
MREAFDDGSDPPGKGIVHRQLPPLMGAHHLDRQVIGGGAETSSGDDDVVVAEEGEGGGQVIGPVAHDDGAADVDAGQT